MTILSAKTVKKIYADFTKILKFKKKGFETKKNFYKNLKQNLEKMWNKFSNITKTLENVGQI